MIKIIDNRVIIEGETIYLHGTMRFPMTAELQSCKIHGSCPTGRVLLDKAAYRKTPHFVINNVIQLNPGMLNKLWLIFKFFVYKVFMQLPPDDRGVKIEGLVCLKEFETGYEIMIDPNDVKGIGENQEDTDMTNIFLRSEPTNYTVVDHPKEEVMAYLLKGKAKDERASNIEEGKS